MHQLPFGLISAGTLQQQKQRSTTSSEARARERGRKRVRIPGLKGCAVVCSSTVMQATMLRMIARDLENERQLSQNTHKQNNDRWLACVSKSLVRVLQRFKGRYVSLQTDVPPEYYVPINQPATPHPLSDLLPANPLTCCLVRAHARTHLQCQQLIALHCCCQPARAISWPWCMRRRAPPQHAPTGPPCLPTRHPTALLSLCCTPQRARLSAATPAAAGRWVDG